MEILVNGQPRQVDSAATLRGFLESLGLATLETGIAVSVNGELVRRAEWPKTRLKARDELEIVQATQGG